MRKSYRDLINNKPKNLKDFKVLKLALLSDQSTQFLKKIIEGFGYEFQLEIKVWEAPINQIEDQILNPYSLFNKSKFDAVIIYESSQSLLCKFDNSNEKSSFAESQFKRINNYVERIIASGNKLILFNFNEINDYVFGNFSAKVPNSFIFQLRKLNFVLAESHSKNSNINTLDLSSIQNLIGSKKLVNRSLYINYEMSIDLDALPYIAKQIIDVLLAQNAIFNKCLILDLDNTLWGGIIGDDGIENIQLGDLGIGKSFYEFQLWVKKLKDRGIIICICSKNNEDVAKDVFLNHPNMILKLEDISVFLANWNSKVDNIKNIQKILKINYDSMVFIDDNEYERNVVKENICGITVPDLPKDPSEYVEFLSNENLFETSSISEFDSSRTKMYQTEQVRLKSKSEFTDLSDYMKSLKMMSFVETLTEFNIPRVSELSYRSNQFNLRTIRYSEEILKKLMNSINYSSLVFSLNDKFGNHGIISFVILKKISDEEVFIENWSMSCRVLERGLEQFIINCILDVGRSLKTKTIVGEYIQTKKNNLVRDVYLKLGFSKRNQVFVLDTSSSKLETLIERSYE